MTRDYHPSSRLPQQISRLFSTHTPPTHLYTLSLHDALPISSPRIPSSRAWATRRSASSRCITTTSTWTTPRTRDRKSTRLNSSHVKISYAVFCLKKKKKITTQDGCTLYKSRNELLHYCPLIP